MEAAFLKILAAIALYFAVLVGGVALVNALVRRRRTTTVAVRVSLRAGNGPALVRKTNVRLRLRRSR